MSTAVMITSSPEDISRLKSTLEIIAFLKQMISKGTNEFYLDINSSVIKSEDINSLDSYYTNMYNLLLNPGMTEEEYALYEESRV